MARSNKKSDTPSFFTRYTRHRADFARALARLYPVLKKREEEKLVLRWKQNQDQDALEKLCIYYEPFCRSFAQSLAHRYGRFGIKENDLFQEAQVGLLQGLVKFDPKRGSRLNNYILPFILQPMIRFTTKNKTVQSQPYNLSGYAKKIMVPWDKAIAKFRESHGRRPLSAGEWKSVAEESGLSFAARDDLLMRLHEPTLPIDRDFPGLIALSDFVENLPDPNADTSLLAKEAANKKSVEILLAGLPERDAAIVRARYLSNPDGDLVSRTKIGLQHDLSHSRIEQIEKAALHAMFERAIVRLFPAEMAEPPPTQKIIELFPVRPTIRQLAS